MTHGFSIDVEEWFDGFTQGSSVGYERRLRSAMDILIDLLEQFNTKATFFWLAGRANEHPDLVKQISQLGHEVGCHGLHHTPVYQSSCLDFRIDVSSATNILEDITGAKVRGFRAPYFSITKKTLWALDILADLGYEYDSSIFPMRHWRYGIAGYPSSIQTLSTPSGSIIEVPLSVRSSMGCMIPVSGGAYFRLYPYLLTQNNIRSLEKKGQQFIFYMHPWELDVHQPRLLRPTREQFPHYYGLNTTSPKLERLLTDFSFTTISTMLCSYTGGNV